MNEEPWKIWAVCELKSWSNWDYHNHIRSYREFVLQCLAAEEWIYKEMFKSDGGQWEKITVKKLCSLHSVGTLKRLAECYSPQGAVFWWGRLSPPLEAWPSANDIAKRAAMAHRDHKRYNSYASDLVSYEWEKPTTRYIPDRFKWDSHKCAYSQFSWSDAVLAAEVYILCRRILAVNVFVYCAEHRQNQEPKMFDLVDALDSVEAIRLRREDIGDGSHVDTSQLSIPLEITERLGNTVLPSAQTLAQELVLALKGRSRPDTHDTETSLRETCRVMAHVIRKLSKYFAVEVTYHNTFYPMFLVDARSADGEFKTERFALDLVQSRVRDYQQVMAVYEEYSETAPDQDPSQTMLDVICKICAVGEDVDSHALIVHLLYQLECGKRRWTDGYSRNASPFRDTRKPFCMSFEVCKSLGDVQIRLDDLKESKLLHNLEDIDMHRTPRMCQLTHIQGLQPSSYHIGQLVAMGNGSREKEWGVITNVTFRREPNERQGGRWYQCKIATRSGRRFFEENEVFETRDSLDPTEVPTLYDNFLLLGRNFKYLENCRFVPNGNFP
jgi:hypothetical protein